ncbi:hypothetical protein BGX31_003281 [Mortierella sp. GBA43]|nr:hypothetical protein BGX31_003281 [Mortierella sp. GBA43]
MRNDDSTEVIVGLTTIEMAVSVDDLGAITFQKQTARIDRAVLRIDSKLLNRLAAHYAENIRTATIEDFKNELTTSTKDIRRNKLRWTHLASKQGCDPESSPQTYWSRRQQYSF